jgi:hypothetical protein
LTSPTQRTLAELKRLGWTAQVVEHWNGFARRRIDLFGVIDIVVIVPYEGHGSPLDHLLGIQCCAGASHATRRTKILAEPRALEWLRAGGKLDVWSWAKQGARGKRKTWTLRIEAITADMFTQASGKDVAA